MHNIVTLEGVDLTPYEKSLVRRYWVAKRLEEQEGRCCYCKRNITQLTDIKDRKATAEHVTPRFLGGLDEFDNIAAVCDPCNSSRSSMPFEEFEVTPAFRQRLFVGKSE